jgi:hypothetical protein
VEEIKLQAVREMGVPEMPHHIATGSHMRAAVSVRETLEERALSWLKAKDDRSKEAAYCMRIIGTKARNAAKREPAKEKRKAVRKMLRRAGETPKTKSDWLREADKWFSRFIRLRDSKAVSDAHCVVCVTCQEIDYITDADNGHWIRRENWGTRFHENNCHSQCKKCNGFRGGEEYKHECAIAKLHGLNEPNHLRQIAKFNNRKPSAVELEAIAKKYEAKVTELGGWPE